ncbi:hypothetical protein RED65_05464 [Oceanobacter sp. RED65]|uniref:tRNA-uridine aminocarboxypropyltransferase n=1 Tax=Bermanella marisrubri TaxID=207949 RepID=Q1N0M4_9GAMM|nr:hypothetical protein RED65_05464 [Oceanobacter sp. RED65] [Bermanella marisrubri]
MLILQHPSEQKQALATVPILQRCVEPCEVWVGEDFSQNPRLTDLLKNPQSLRVVFPSSGATDWYCDQPDTSVSNHVSTVILIDGTWNKAKKIWHMNPWLHSLPAVHLKNFPATEYRIRQSSVEGSLSTLEAAMHSLNWLTGSARFDDLAKPFEAMIDMQIQKMGKEIFDAHYCKEDD